MGNANYIDKVGKQVNDSTKYNVKLDRTSIKGVILISHFNELLKKLEVDTTLTEEEKKKAIDKINGYINCMKKEMNFYPFDYTTNDRVLTEVDENIIQE